MLREKSEKHTHTHGETHKHGGEKKRRRSQVKHTTHTGVKMRGRVRRGRPFTLFYDLWLIFSSVYMNC